MDVVPSGEEESPPPSEAATPTAAANSSSCSSSTGTRQHPTNKRGGGGGGASSSSSSAKQQPAPVDAAFIALLATAAQQLIQAGFPATAHILQTEGIPPPPPPNNNNSTIAGSGGAGSGGAGSGGGGGSSNNNNSNNSNDPPFHVHWSKSDMASSLRTDTNQSSNSSSSSSNNNNNNSNTNSNTNNNTNNNNNNNNNATQYDNGQRLSLHGAIRSGYRMARASHGASTGTYYYECVLLPGPTAMELLHHLPANARLGSGLKEQLQTAVAWEEQRQQRRERRRQQQHLLHQQEMMTTTNDDDDNDASSSATTVSSKEASMAAAAVSSPNKKKRKTTATTISPTTTANNTTDTGCSSAATTATDLGTVQQRGPKQQQQQQPPADYGDDGDDDDDRHRPPHPCGHVRLGWSMRTADLQAPVGYDKWSYAIRSINGALVHNSQRDDHWGGEPFRDYDVIGCCLQLQALSSSAAAATTTTTATTGVVAPGHGGADNNNTASSSSSSSSSNTANNNTIRFFKNGNCLGKFAIVKGKLDGGVAFTDLAPGTYYPAVSCYLGGAVRANFGPYWICPPKKSRLNLAIEPVSALRGAPPASADSAVDQLAPIIKLFKRGDQQQGLKRLIRDEASRQREAHERFLVRHVAEIRALRRARGAATHDLPADPSSDPSTTTTTTTP